MISIIGQCVSPSPGKCLPNFVFDPPGCIPGVDDPCEVIPDPDNPFTSVPCASLGYEAKLPLRRIELVGTASGSGPGTSGYVGEFTLNISFIFTRISLKKVKEDHGGVIPAGMFTLSQCDCCDSLGVTITFGSDELGYIAHVDNPDNTYVCTPPVGDECDIIYRLYIQHDPEGITLEWNYCEESYGFQVNVQLLAIGGSGALGCPGSCPFCFVIGIGGLLNITADEGESIEDALFNNVWSQTTDFTCPEGSDGEATSSIEAQFFKSEDGD